ncbi:MAG: transposase [Methylomicrobium sp.]|jgi:transposase
MPHAALKLSDRLADELDSAALVIPDNLTLLHLPAYSPKLNPAESLWRELATPLSRQSMRPLQRWLKLT